MIRNPDPKHLSKQTHMSTSSSLRSKDRDVTAKNAIVSVKPSLKKTFSGKENILGQHSSKPPAITSHAQVVTRSRTASAPKARRNASPFDSTRVLTGRSQVPIRVSIDTNVRSISRGKKVGTSSDSNLQKKAIRVYSDCGKDRNSVENTSNFKEKSGPFVEKSGVGTSLMNTRRKNWGDSKVEVKYPSKPHEKLDYLEDKVNKISSEIKRLKEMLNTSSNEDVSKGVLEGIQDQISGIEKAMESVGNVNAKTSENDLVKGLNNEELEARLFPHQRLLRDRSSKASSGNSHSQDHELSESGSEFNKENKPLSGFNDNNPIAMEFLDSLNKERCNVFRKSENVVLGTSSTTKEKHDLVEMNFMTNEVLDEVDDYKENRQAMMIDEEIEDECINRLNQIGCKASTGGWFVSEGEAVILAHDDGSCTYYDIANCETKAEYRPPAELSFNIWRDCWTIRASDADGCSGRYVVAASAGNSMDSGFCSWDFYTKDVKSFHIEDENPASRSILAPLPVSNMYRRNALSTIMAAENRQWWYRPCGHLIISTATCQQVVGIFDIRDGEKCMQWEVPKPVLTMDYSSPVQWRNRGKVVIAEADTVSLWDVNSVNPQAVLSVSLSGRTISALHVNNTDAELGGGARQRVSSSEVEGNDGVCCTADSINILDFRHPSGIGLKIPKLGVYVHSIYSRGDSIFLGCTNAKGKNQFSQIQQFSLRKQRLVTTYALPESNAHSNYTNITQVWGNSNLVIGVCGLGMFVFDAMMDDGMTGYSDARKDRESFGSDDLYSPSFDYSGSRALLVSRDRPALWRYLS